MQAYLKNKEKFLFVAYVSRKLGIYGLLRGPTTQALKRKAAEAGFDAIPVVHSSISEEQYPPSYRPLTVLARRANNLRFPLV